MLTHDQPLSSFTTLTGATVSGAILSSNALTPTPHDWSADATGLYHTGTNLANEWDSYYQTMQGGGAASLSDVQRLEGNAQALFKNTGLASLDAATQGRDREDVQRQFDAMAAAMTIAGVDASKAFTQAGYLTVEHTIQANATLDELFKQGHGLNNAGLSRYAGYTNDFQHNVDNSTRFIGGGIQDNNQRAIEAFFDDNALSHIGFSVIAKNGELIQLNQNGAAEDGVLEAVVALNDSMVYRVYGSVDFANHGPTAASNKATAAPYWTAQDKLHLAALQADAAAPAPSGQIKTLFGLAIADTMTFNVGNGITHTWRADANGLFQTATDLAAEWRAAYVDLVTTGGKSLSVEQRVEANAEALFENSGLAQLNAARQAVDRADAQRQFDAEFAAMRLAGVDPAAPFTASSYLQLSQTLRFDAALDELATQGHGLNAPPSSRYAGYTNDFQNNVDNTTKFVGRGLEHNQTALPDLFDDLVLGHALYPVVALNGKLVQLNQNGKPEVCLSRAVGLLNEITHAAAMHAQDFAA